jgi:hypothetical protein
MKSILKDFAIVYGVIFAIILFCMTFAFFDGVPTMVAILAILLFFVIRDSVNILKYKRSLDV